MILSSADILRKLGSDAIVRQCARLSIVDGNPGFDTDEYVYIYIDRYPEVAEFEATWKIWILDGGSDFSELVLDTVASLLPGFQKNGSHYITTDFATDRTVVKSEAAIQLEQLERDRKTIKKDFKGLSEAVEGQLKGVRDGIDGIDGKDGKDGSQGLRGYRGERGRDGKDLLATDANLDDLQDVEMGLAMEKGQVLTWDGTQWTNLFVPQLSSVTVGRGSEGGGDGGGIPEAPEDGQEYVRKDGEWVVSSGGGGGGIPEAPVDGSYYVRSSGIWVNLTDALGALGVAFTEPVDAGDFTSGLGSAISNRIYDGGNFTAGTTSAPDSKILDGGITTP